ncbi:SLAC1 anion channel family protein [Advenella sp. WQ 585]|uniref:SLAC1 anion channel family protein n=1 Tax=Advenella mandrilli TaxID=2800330 RepID=A0ABS1EFV4_9BURK|nr:SLAC1 anion channel family protein [Advenella mandrilli]MBK1781800.1 SLAC1 anion channel family protein [Advenella mandrilli]
MSHSISSNLPAQQNSRLAYFPVALFSSVMGMAGLAIAWLKAAQAFNLPLGPGIGIRWLATLLYVFLLIVYTSKLFRFPDEVKKEWCHPVKINFMAAITIGLLLVSISWLSAPGVSKWMWAVATIGHFLLTIAVINSWLNKSHYQITHVNPAWFIPVVGNILIPIAGVHHAPADISWFFFSIGLVFWVVLMTIVFYRIFFHDPLPAKMTPTLFILIAPPSVAFISYLALNHHQLDGFARVLYFFALFLTLLLASNALRFFRLPFALSAWAYSFPLAAITIATTEMATQSAGSFYSLLAGLLLFVLSGIILILTYRTLLAVKRKQICLPEH